MESDQPPCSESEKEELKVGTVAVEQEPPEIAPERPPSTTSSATSEEIPQSAETDTNKGQIGTPKAEPKKGKINILLKPVGDAPILKQKLWAVDPDKQIASILQFVKSYLKGEGNLFLFVNQAFAPSLDQTVKNLYDVFGSDGKLVLHYSTTVAWG